MSKMRSSLHFIPSAKSSEDAAAADMKPVEFKSQPASVQEMVNTQIAAGIIGRSPDTLKRWRYEGVGPEYSSFRGRVRYDVRVLARFNEENTRMPSVRAAMEADRGDF